MDKELKYDIVVVGGGSAGVAAAVASANEGFRVCLIEKYGFLGGQAVSSNVGTICGLYHGVNTGEIKAGKYVQEFVGKLQKLSFHQVETYENSLAYLPYDSWAFQSVSLSLLEESKVDFLLHATCIDIEESEGKILNIIVLVGTNKIRIEASAFVDATGEGLLSKLGNADLIEDENYHAPGFVIGVTDINVPKSITEREFSLAVLSKLIEAEQSGSIQVGRGRISVVPGSLTASSCTFKFAYPFQRLNELGSDTTIEVFGRTSCFKIFTYLKSSSSFFANAKLNLVSTQAGMRSGSRGLGKYVLSKSDFLSSSKFDTFVANGLWPIEIWDESRKVKLVFSDTDDFYQIPAFSLCSMHFSNLFLSGRGVSADKDALSSCRVIATSMATGYASGVLASSVFGKISFENTIKKIQNTQY